MIPRDWPKRPEYRHPFGQWTRESDGLTITIAEADGTRTVYPIADGVAEIKRRDIVTRAANDAHDLAMPVWAAECLIHWLHGGGPNQASVALCDTEDGCEFTIRIKVQPVIAPAPTPTQEARMSR